MKVGDIVKVSKPNTSKKNIKIRRRPKSLRARKIRKLQNSYGIITKIDTSSEVTFCSVFIKGGVFYTRARNLKVVK